MITVQIEYFAILREHIGKNAEEVQTEVVTAGELYDELAARYAFPHMTHMKVAINDEFSEWGAALAEGDSIVFIPPVAGG
ncbi:MAG: MoaD/ThiS family protein [Gammaproteobacteria bacterium]|jgi:molybdopterin converting factor subunit 1|nr:molybdopterin synthase sulfur carrier subunit [Chromatiales bacterium]MDP6673587.1 MoaD/ThiS family protein [Gammaproteobacteria bacterium]